MLFPIIGLTALVIALGFLPRPYLNVAAGGAGGLLYSESYIGSVLGAEAADAAIGQELGTETEAPDENSAEDSQSGDGS